MSVEYLRMYLTGNVQAGMKLLENSKYDQRVSRAVRRMTSPCPEQFDTVMELAQQHVLEQVYAERFLKPSLRRSFKEHGGSIENNGDGKTEIWVVSDLIQDCAALLNQTIPSRYERFCCDDLDIQHPLRATLLHLVLSDDEVCSRKLDEFYIWAIVVAQNRARDYLRRERRIRERQDALFSRTDISTAEEFNSALDLWRSLEAEERARLIVELVEKIDRAYPEHRFLDLWHRLLAEIPQRDIAAEFELSPSQITKRKKKMEQLLTIELRSLQDEGNAFIDIELPESRRRTNEVW